MIAVEISRALLPAWYLRRDGINEAEKKDTARGKGILWNSESEICSQFHAVFAQSTPFQSRLPESKVNNLHSAVRNLMPFQPPQSNTKLNTLTISIKFLSLPFPLSFPTIAFFPEPDQKASKIRSDLSIPESRHNRLCISIKIRQVIRLIARIKQCDDYFTISRHEECFEAFAHVNTLASQEAHINLAGATKI
jgi:hypothetical protein